MINEEMIKKDYVDQATAAKMLDITRGRISILCKGNRFEGAIKIGWSWIIPKNSVLNFQRLKRGVKPQGKRQSADKTIIKKALEEYNRWKER